MASNPGYHLFYFTSSYCWQSERTKCPWIATFGAWVLAQNSACVYTLSTQYVSVYIIYSLSPCQTPFWNASLAGGTEQWIVLELATMMRTQGPGAHFSSARVRRRLLLLAYKVFGPTLAPLPEFRRAQWVPCLGTQCVRCLSPFSNISALFAVQEVMGRAKNATQAFSFVWSLPLLLRRDLLYMGRFCPEVQPLTILYVKVPLSYLFALVLTNGTPCTYRNLEGFIPFDCLFYM